MSRYLPGDVVLAWMQVAGRGAFKVRPAVVIAEGEDGSFTVCPVSSRPARDSPSLPLALDDFATGGLDLFSESFVLVEYAAVVRSADIVGLKGRLSFGTADELVKTGR